MSKYKYTEATKMTSMQKVTQLFKKTAYALNRIIVGRDTLWATPEHKFFIAAKGWVQAAGLTAGMLMQSQVGTAAINSNVAIDTVAEVYNFTVENNHTYYVGKGALLTHNRCKEIADLIKSGKLDAKYAYDFEKQFGNTPLFKKFVDGDLDARAWEAILKKTPAYHLSVRTTYLKIIQNGGNAVLQQDGTIKLFSKNGHFATLLEGRILPRVESISPKNKHFFHPQTHNGAVKVGDKMNGYEVWQKGDDFVVKRVPDESAYTTVEKALLKDHPDAHTLDRHGPDVTDEALIQRANTGIAPDGSKIYTSDPDFYPLPTHSSKFDSPEQLSNALKNVKPTSPAFEAALASAPPGTNKITVKHELLDGSTYGKGVPMNSNIFETSRKVRAYYKKSPTTGNWELTTMFPDF